MYLQYYNVSIDVGNISYVKNKQEWPLDYEID